MIRITKPDPAPAKLAQGAALTAANHAAYVVDPQNNGSRANPFTFDKKIYGHSSVKRALRHIQHDKCCYCEGHFAAHAAGDVEHFRPKTRFTQSSGSPHEYPGYYWLAYEWANLYYYVCERCNREGKRDLFPLADPATRARRPSDPLAAETPMILDPGGTENPRDHIRFHGALPYGISDIGRETVKLLKLDRIELTTDRLKHLKMLESLRTIARLAIQGLELERGQARRELERAMRPEVAYSAMAQDFLART